MGAERKGTERRKVNSNCSQHGLRSSFESCAAVGLSFRLNMYLDEAEEVHNW